VKNVTEILRLPSPAPRPQSLAFDGTTLWMGSLATRRIYAIDPEHWTAREETEAPGLPYGMTAVGDQLRVLCSETPDDHRIIRQLIPGHGIKNGGAIPCPEDTGSQLAFDGERLYVSQWYNKLILGIDEAGNVLESIELPHGICGIVFTDGCFFAATTDDENGGDYWLTRVDVRPGGKIEDVARIPFAARALAFDGTHFWSNHRERGEIVAFTA
jgi:hypothetical protein